MYDEGLTQQQMQRRLLDHMDTEIAAVAKDLLIEKHQLTVKNYEQSLTSASTRQRRSTAAAAAPIRRSWVLLRQTRC